MASFRGLDCRNPYLYRQVVPVIQDGALRERTSAVLKGAAFRSRNTFMWQRSDAHLLSSCTFASPYHMNRGKPRPILAYIGDPGVIGHHHMPQDGLYIKVNKTWGRGGFLLWLVFDIHLSKNSNLHRSGSSPKFLGLRSTK